MRTLLRFNLCFLPLLALALAFTGYMVRETLHHSAENEVLQYARVMMATATAARLYTTKQIVPLIERERFKTERATDALQQTLDQQLPAALQAAAERLPNPQVRPDVLNAHRQVLDTLRAHPRETPEADFYPQSVPAYAATEVFNLFKAKYPDYAYKEATLNPTNPRDRTADWEADVVNWFRGQPAQPEFVSRRETPTGTTLFLAVPIKITDANCLACHSTPDKAPPEMLKLYGPGNGFGWKMDEIIGAQIVSVPVKVPVSIADGAFRNIARGLGAIFGLFVVVTAGSLFMLAMSRRRRVHVAG